MSRSTPRWFHDKRAFYSLPSVSASYDALRFGGPSGERVNRRELETVERLLEGVPAGGRLLDLGSGTGRLAGYLRDRRYRIVALDASWPMVQRTRAALAVLPPDGPEGGVVQGDAFALPFAAGTFDGVAALRLAFHWRNLESLLAEMRRVAAPAAPLVLDTYTWTPRALLALDATRWGGKVFAHSPAMVRALAPRLGLAVEAEVRCFLCSPYVYRRLPLPVLHALERLEAAAPPAWLARVFWRLRRAET